MVGDRCNRLHLVPDQGRDTGRGCDEGVNADTGRGVALRQSPSPSFLDSKAVMSQSLRFTKWVYTAFIKAQGHDARTISGLNITHAMPGKIEARYMIQDYNGESTRGGAQVVYSH